MTNFRDFFLEKTDEEREAYAKAAGTTIRYIEGHLVNRLKVPRKKLLENLVKASDGKLSTRDLTDFFYKIDIEQLGQKPSTRQVKSDTKRKPVQTEWITDQ